LTNELMPREEEQEEKKKFPIKDLMKRKKDNNG